MERILPIDSTARIIDHFTESDSDYKKRHNACYDLFESAAKCGILRSSFSEELFKSAIPSSKETLEFMHKSKVGSCSTDFMKLYGDCMDKESETRKKK